MNITIHPHSSLENYKYADIVSIYQDKWILSKHKNRSTWETQGGHIKPNESPLECAGRELYEESGAVDFDIYPLCDYALQGEFNGRDVTGNSQVFFAVVRSLSNIPKNSEMECIDFFSQLPDNLTYPVLSDLFKIAESMRMKIRKQMPEVVCLDTSSPTSPNCS